MRPGGSTADVLERVRDALQRHDYARAVEIVEAAELTGQLNLEAEPERVSERMRRTIQQDNPPGNAALAAQPIDRELRPDSKENSHG